MYNKFQLRSKITVNAAVIRKRERTDKRGTRKGLRRERSRGLKDLFFLERISFVKNIRILHILESEGRKGVERIGGKGIIN